MKRFISLFFISLFIACHSLWCQVDFYADFETFDTSPYVFRFGNNKSPDYYPRWQYAHQIVDNPLANEANPSEKVLEYSSLEAREYGLKVLFSAPMNISDIDTVRFLIYQPENIVGKEVHAGYSHSPATTQEIRVKLLTYFNTIMDHRQDDGVVLTLAGAVKPFTATGEWVTYEVVVDENKFTQANQAKLKQGVLGIAILPTYGGEVTLQSRHVCYIDNIEVKKEETISSVHKVEDMLFISSYSEGIFTVQSSAEGEAEIKVYDMRGALMKDFGKNILGTGVYHYPLDLPAGMYISSVKFNGRYFNRKMQVPWEK